MASEPVLDLVDDLRPRLTRLLTECGQASILLIRLRRDVHWPESTDRLAAQDLG